MGSIMAFTAHKSCSKCHFPVFLGIQNTSVFQGLVVGLMCPANSCSSTNWCKCSSCSFCKGHGSTHTGLSVIQVSLMREKHSCSAAVQWPLLENRVMRLCNMDCSKLSQDIASPQGAGHCHYKRCHSSHLPIRSLNHKKMSSLSWPLHSSHPYYRRSRLSCGPIRGLLRTLYY